MGGLSCEHFNSAYGLAPGLPGLRKKSRLQWVIDQVISDLHASQCLTWHGALAGPNTSHANRSCIDQNAGAGRRQSRQVRGWSPEVNEVGSQSRGLSLIPCVDGTRGAFPGHAIGNSPRRAARANYGARRARKRRDPFQRLNRARYIGIESMKLAVADYNRVDCADRSGDLVQPVKQRSNRFLMWDRYPASVTRPINLPASGMGQP